MAAVVVARTLAHMHAARQADTTSTAAAGSPVANEEKPIKLAAGPIIGVTAAGIIVILAIVFGIAFYMRRKRNRRAKEAQAQRAKVVVDAMPLETLPTVRQPQPYQQHRQQQQLQQQQDETTTEDEMPPPPPKAHDSTGIVDPRTK